MGRPRTLVILLGAVAAAAASAGLAAAVVAVAVVRHGRGAATGRTVVGGILIGDPAAYDVVSRHGHLTDPVEHAPGSSLRVVNATPWRWPWRFKLAQRIEPIRDG